jgi:hypothetical protein
MDGWVDGWMGGCKSRFKDCLQQSKRFQNLSFLNISAIDILVAKKACFCSFLQHKESQKLPQKNCLRLLAEFF